MPFVEYWSQTFNTSAYIYVHHDKLTRIHHSTGQTWDRSGGYVGFTYHFKNSTFHAVVVVVGWEAPPFLVVGIGGTQFASWWFYLNLRTLNLYSNNMHETDAWGELTTGRLRKNRLSLRNCQLKCLKDFRSGRVSIHWSEEYIARFNKEQPTNNVNTVNQLGLGNMRILTDYAQKPPGHRLELHWTGFCENLIYTNLACQWQRAILYTHESALQVGVWWQDCLRINFAKTNFSVCFLFFVFRQKSNLIWSSQHCFLTKLLSQCVRSQFWTYHGTSTCYILILAKQY